MSRDLTKDCVMCEHLEEGKKGECCCRGQCKEETGTVESLTMQAFNPLGDIPLELGMSFKAVRQEM